MGVEKTIYTQRQAIVILMIWSKDFLKKRGKSLSFFDGGKSHGVNVNTCVACVVHTVYV